MLVSFFFFFFLRKQSSKSQKTSLPIAFLSHMKEANY